MKFTHLYILLLLGYIFSTGIFNISGLVILLGCFVLFLVYQHKKENPLILSQTIIITLALSVLTEHILYPLFPQVNYLIKLVLIFSFFLSFSYLFRFRLFKPKFTFPVLILIGILLRVFVIFASPYPKIDVFYLLKEAPQFLLKGINPYSAMYTQVYPQVKPDYYTYLPFSFILLVPINFLLGDPRFLYVAVYILLIYLIKKTARREKAEIYILLFLFQPLSLLVFEQGYLDILLLGLLTFSLYFLKYKKYSLGCLCLGMAIATKQSAILVLPFFWAYLDISRKKIKNLLFLIIPGVVTIVPFLIWNLKDFWYDAAYYLLNMDVIRSDKIIFSQNILTLILKITGFRLSSIPFYSLLMLVIIYLVVKKIRPPSFSLLPFNLAVFFLGFHLFATQAYINYFFLISNLLILSQVFKE